MSGATGGMETENRSAQIRQTDARLARLEQMYEELSQLEARAVIQGSTEKGMARVRSPGKP